MDPGLGFDPRCDRRFTGRLFVDTPATCREGIEVRLEPLFHLHPLGPRDVKDATADGDVGLGLLLHDRRFGAVRCARVQHDPGCQGFRGCDPDGHDGNLDRCRLCRSRLHFRRPHRASVDSVWSGRLGDLLFPVGANSTLDARLAALHAGSV